MKEHLVLSYILFGLALIISILIPLLIYRYVKGKKVLVLPANFLIENFCIDSTIKVLRGMMTTRQRKVFLDFSQLKSLSYEAYLILLAQAEKAYFKKKAIYITNIPQIATIRTILFGKNSNHKTVRRYFDISENKEQSTFIRNAKIPPNLILGIETELKRIGIKDYFEFNSFLTELVGNAIEHGISEKKINWWMHYYLDRKTKCVHFMFVDMGRGIVSSYKDAQLIPDRHASIADVLMLALNGKLGSSTKQANRGRGMPQIKRMVEKKCISDFVLITNKVSLRYIDGSFVTKEHENFIGTYYSWSVNKENFSSWKNSE